MPFFHTRRILRVPATDGPRSCILAIDIASNDMAEPGRTGPVTGLLIGLGGCLWLLGLIRVFAPGPVVTAVLSACLVCFVLLSLPRTGWHTRVLCLVLAAATRRTPWCRIS